MKQDNENPESRFAEIIEGYEVKTDWKEYPNWLFFFKNGKLLGEFFLETQTFYASLGNLWSVFENEFEMGYVDIQRFIGKQVEKHFKLNVSETPAIWRRVTRKVEKHFKLKVSETPWPASAKRRKVEEHFKLNVSETLVRGLRAAGQVEEHFKLNMV